MSNKRINLLVDAVKMLIIIAIACLLVTIIVFISSDEPATALYSFFIGPFTSVRRIGNIIEGATPLMFTALAVMLIFGAGQFSMISEGAFFIGVTAAMVVAITLPLPAGIHPVVAVLCAALAGSTIAAVPALLKMKWRVSEVVTSIMMNYVVQFFAIYLVTYHFREASSSSLASVKFLETSQIPTIIGGTRIHAGVVVALLLCLALWLFMFRSKLGFKMRLTGDNPSFAHYVGVREKGVMVAAQVIAGGIAGAGGGVEVLSMYNRFKWTATPGYGWTGIVVALLAKNNPLLVPFAACFISYINTGANVMAMNSDVGSDMALVIQGAIMLLIASSALLQHWRQKLIVKAAEAEQRQLESQAASAEQYERV